MIGVSLIVCVWKLKGLRAPGGGGGPMLPLPSLIAGLTELAGEFMEEFIAPKRADPGKNSDIGDNAAGSKVIVERIVRGTPSIPSGDWVSSSSRVGVGGVGVRGGAGTGRLEAIATVYRPRGSMRRSARM